MEFSQQNFVYQHLLQHLATMSICRGFAYIITGGSPIGVTNPKFTFLGTGYVFNLIPLPVIFMIIVLILGMILVKHTRFGRYIYSCGGNAQAAKWSGINVDKIRITVIRNCRIFKWICGNHSGRKTWRWITGNRRRVRNGCYYSGCAGRNQYVWRKRQTLGSCPGCADYRSTDKWTYYDKCIQLLAKSN